MNAVQHKQPGVDRLLKAAKTLFSTNGFHQTSMAELATAADMSVGLIYRCFKSKSEIIEAIVRGDVAERLAELDDLRRRFDEGELTVTQALRELFLQVLDKEDEAFACDIIAEGFRTESVGQTIGEMCGCIREHLRGLALAANPRLKGEELEGATELMLGCLFSLEHRSISMPSLDISRASEIYARMIVAALEAI